MPGLSVSYDKIYVGDRDRGVGDHEMWIRYQNDIGLTNSDDTYTEIFNSTNKFLENYSIPTTYELKGKDWTNINYQLIKHKDMKIDYILFLQHDFYEDDGDDYGADELSTLEDIFAILAASFSTAYLFDLVLQIIGWTYEMIKFLPLLYQFGIGIAVIVVFFALYNGFKHLINSIWRNDFYGDLKVLNGWKEYQWFGAHPINGYSGKEIPNSDNKPVKTKYKVELYKSEDPGNDTKFE